MQSTCNFKTFYVNPWKPRYDRFCFKIYITGAINYYYVRCILITSSWIYFKYFSLKVLLFHINPQIFTFNIAVNKQNIPFFSPFT